MGSPFRHGAAYRRWFAPGPVVVLLLATALLVWQRPELGETVGPVGVMIGYATAGVLLLVRSAPLEVKERRAWRVMGLGALTAAAGILCLAVLTELGYEPPAFGPADAFFLGGYALLITGIYRLTRVEGSGRDWLTTLADGLIGGIALAALVWVFFFHELVDALSSAPWWEIAIAVTYPIFGLATVVGLIILVIRRSHYRLDPRLMFLGMAMLFQVMNDWAYLSSGVGRSFEEAQPAFPIMLLAVTSHVVLGTIVDIVPKKREFPEQDAPIWAIFWPYLLAAALLGALVGRYRSLTLGSDEQVLFISVILIGVVIFLRQVMIIHRNRVRVENQRSELVASVSHELRTPLTAVVGYLAVLDEQGEQFPESAREEMISEANDQARHMSRLVADLVMLARGGQNALPLQINEVAVSNLTTAALRNVEPRNTRIEERLETEAIVQVDADRMQQCFANLLSNAVKYGGDQALLVVKTDDADLIVEVHDNGDGVPTRYEARIWRRFERGVHRLDSTAPGLGIGLAIVEAVAESHGGRASYRRSEELGGACFTVTIPDCVIREMGQGSAEPSSYEYGQLR